MLPQNVEEEYKALEEVSRAVERMSKTFGRHNLEILVAHNCTFSGTRGIDGKIQVVRHVFEQFDAICKDLKREDK